MTLLTLFAYVALGAVLAGACLAWLRRPGRSVLRCIAPYVPAEQRNALPAPPP